MIKNHLQKKQEEKHNELEPDFTKQQKQLNKQNLPFHQF